MVPVSSQNQDFAPIQRIPLGRGFLIWVILSFPNSGRDSDGTVGRPFLQMHQKIKTLRGEIKMQRRDSYNPTIYGGVFTKHDKTGFSHDATRLGIIQSWLKPKVKLAAEPQPEGWGYRVCHVTKSHIHNPTIYGGVFTKHDKTGFSHDATRLGIIQSWLKPKVKLAAEPQPEGWGYRVCHVTKSHIHNPTIYGGVSVKHNKTGFSHDATRQGTIQSWLKPKVKLAAAEPQS